MNVITLLGALSACPWRLVLGLLLCLTFFIAGFAMGQRNVQRAWKTERLQQQALTLQQSLQVARVETQQERINQKVSTDYETQKSMLARRAPVLRDGALSMCIPSSHAAGPVPTNAEFASSADAAATNPVPDPARDSGAISCEQLARDAANTTLMVLSFQRWHAEQAKAQDRVKPVAPEP